MYAGCTPKAFSDQKLLSINRSSGRPPNQAMPRRTVSSRIGEMPVRMDVTFDEAAENHSDTMSGVMPSTRPGSPIRSVHATASFGRLISASKLPASENNERRLVLDASSSMSPSRGSMIGFIQTRPNLNKSPGVALFRRSTVPQREPRRYMRFVLQHNRGGWSGVLPDGHCSVIVINGNRARRREEGPVFTEEALPCVGST